MQTVDRYALLNDLDEHQLRVLGCLAEKQLAMPRQYPMTINAIQRACNQSTGRKPAMSLEEGQVQRALSSLQLNRLVLTDRSGRSVRYSHLLNKHLALELPQFAILTTLLLQGPLTTDEIHAATRKLYVFESSEAVRSAIDSCDLIAPLAGSQTQHGEQFNHTLRAATGRGRNLSTHTPADESSEERVDSTAQEPPLQAPVYVHGQPVATSADQNTESLIEAAGEQPLRDITSVVVELRQLKSLLEIDQANDLITNPVRPRSASS